MHTPQSGGIILPFHSLLLKDGWKNKWAHFAPSLACPAAVYHKTEMEGKNVCRWCVWAWHNRWHSCGLLEKPNAPFPKTFQELRLITLKNFANAFKLTSHHCRGIWSQSSCTVSVAVQKKTKKKLFNCLTMSTWEAWCWLLFKTDVFRAGVRLKKTMEFENEVLADLEYKWTTVGFVFHLLFVLVGKNFKQ